MTTKATPAPNAPATTTGETTAPRSLRDRAKADAEAQAIATKEPVEFPDRGLRFEVRAMRAGEVVRLMEDGFEAAIERQAEGGAKRVRRARLRTYFPIVIAGSTYDPETGDRVWDPAKESDLEEIRALAVDVFDKLADAGMRVNGLSAEARVARGNVSGAPQSDAPSTDSPSALAA
ncbi:MAG TPA: hypothetical protein VFS08_10420 [Gemmatimonadaceae bacterium]|nr:hypothetical protein [Gemmatimonadaceae bacterium]